MKKTVIFIFTLVLTVFVFASCDSEDLGEFDPNALDVFGVFTPQIMKLEPERVYEEGVEDVVGAERYDITYTYTVTATGDELSDELKKEYESASGEIRIIKTEEGFSYWEKASAEGASEQSIVCVDGIMYVKEGARKAKQEITEDRYKSALASVETLLTVMISNFDDDTYNGVRIKRDGDLFRIDLPVDDDDELIVDETFVEGDVSAWFDEDGALVRYKLSAVLEDEIDENGLVRLVQIYELRIKDAENAVTAPEDADSYKVY